MRIFRSSMYVSPFSLPVSAGRKSIAAISSYATRSDSTCVLCQKEGKKNHLIHDTVIATTHTHHTHPPTHPHRHTLSLVLCASLLGSRDKEDNIMYFTQIIVTEDRSHDASAPAWSGGSRAGGFGRKAPRLRRGPSRRRPSRWRSQTFPRNAAPSGSRCAPRFPSDSPCRRVRRDESKAEETFLLLVILLSLSPDSTFASTLRTNTHTQRDRERIERGKNKLCV